MYSSRVENSYLNPLLFSDCSSLERHIYENFWNDNCKYIYSSNCYNGVRLLLLKEKSIVRLFYCINTEHKRDRAIVPKVSEENQLLAPYKIKEVVSPVYPYKKLLEVFLDHCEKNDTIKTHEKVYLPEEETLLYKELESYLN